jgi:hypothetical protein
MQQHSLRGRRSAPTGPSTPAAESARPLQCIESSLACWMTGISSPVHLVASHRKLWRPAAEVPGIPEGHGAVESGYARYNKARR